MKLKYREQVVSDGDIIEIPNYDLIGTTIPRIHVFWNAESGNYISIATWAEEVKE